MDTWLTHSETVTNDIQTLKRPGSYSIDYNPNAVDINVIIKYVLTLCNSINYENFKNVWIKSPYI